MIRTTHKIFLALGTICVVGWYGPQALAQSAEIQAKIDRLKDNVSAARANLEQFQLNQKISDQNLRELNRVIKTLEDQRHAMDRLSQKTKERKQTAESAQKQVSQYLTEEQKVLAAEERQAAELRAALQTLEARKKQRTEIISTYKEFLAKKGTDHGDQAKLEQSLSELQKTLDGKLTQAKADRTSAQDKKKEYDSEVDHWSKELKSAELSSRELGKLKPGKK